MIFIRMCVALSILVVPACAEDKSDTGDVFSGMNLVAYDPDKLTILVEDSGFDLEAPGLKESVVAAYTLECDSTVPWEYLPSGGFLTGSLSKMPGCRYVPGIENPPDTGLDKFLPYREKWNRGILNKNLNEELSDIPGNEDGSLIYRIGVSLYFQGPDSYHGGAVAGIISRNNPEVQLVLISRALENRFDGNEHLLCDTLEKSVSFFERMKDPVKARRWIEEPITETEVQFRHILQSHNVKIVNRSWGYPARSEHEALFSEKGCGITDLSESYLIFNALDQQRREYLDRVSDTAHRALYFLSAGNEGSRLDRLKDTDRCQPREDTVVVGGLDYEENRAEWSNHGDCVDFYLPGTNVISLGPSGFMYMYSGTSFSTPLLVKYVSGFHNASSSYSEILGTVEDIRSSGHMPGNSYVPEGILYDSPVPYRM